MGAPSNIAAFPTMTAGWNALSSLLTSKINSTNGTLSAIGTSWVGGNAADGQIWANGVARYSGQNPWSYPGVSTNTPLDPNNPQQMAAVQYGVAAHEWGSTSQATQATQSFPGGAPAGSSAAGDSTPPVAGGGSSAFTSGDGSPSDFAAIGANNTQQYDAAGNPVSSGGLTDAGIDSGQNYGSPNSISQMTPDQAAQMGVDMNGNPLPSGSSTPTGGGLSSLPGPLGTLFGGGGGSGNALVDQLGGGQGGGGLTPQTDQYASSGSAGQDSSSGAPVYLTDPNAVASKAGASVQKGAQELGKNITETGKAVDQTLNQDTSQITNEATSLGNFTGQLLQNSDTGLLPRIGVGLVAIVLIGLGIWMIGKNEVLT